MAGTDFRPGEAGRRAAGVRVVAGEWGGRRIQAPPGSATRPTTDRVREAWMSALSSDLPGARVLDLFAGSGALGLEALSRGAAHATFVERAPAAIRVLRDNLEALGAGERATVVRGDALRFVEALGNHASPFDIVVADPPYGQGIAASLLERFSSHPFAAVISVEHRRDEALPALSDLRTRRYGDTALSFLSAP